MDWNFHIVKVLYVGFKLISIEFVIWRKWNSFERTRWCYKYCARFCVSLLWYWCRCQNPFSQEMQIRLAKLWAFLSDESHKLFYFKRNGPNLIPIHQIACSVKCSAGIVKFACLCTATAGYHLRNIVLIEIVDNINYLEQMFSGMILAPYYSSDLWNNHPLLIKQLKTLFKKSWLLCEYWFSHCSSTA